MMAAKESHSACTVYGEKILCDKAEVLFYGLRVRRADAVKEPRIAMICQDCGLRYAKKQGDA